MPTPVAEAAAALGLPVMKTPSLKGQEIIDRLAAYSPDVIVLVAFGLMIPAPLLAMPREGCVNLHPSLLPKYRGAAPIHAPLLHGDTLTGVTTMWMSETLDAGDVILQRPTVIDPDEDAGALHDRLAVMGAELLVETLDRIAAGGAPRTPQDDGRATYMGKVERVALDWERPAAELARIVRGLSPVPGAYTWWGPLRVKVRAARPVAADQGGAELPIGTTDRPPGATASPHGVTVQPLRGTEPPLGATEEIPDATVHPRGDTDPQQEASARPGLVLRVQADGIAVAAGRGALLLTEVQPEGKGVMSAADFARGYGVKAGLAFGAHS